MQFYGTFFMHPYMQSSRWKDNLDKKKRNIISFTDTTQHNNPSLTYYGSVESSSQS
jgi:hypothetical protein